MKNQTLKNVSERGNLVSQMFLLIGLVTLIITFFYVSQTAFDKKVSLAGDNAGYYILGKSLAQGTGFTNTHDKQLRAHNHFPVGYPLIIAATIKLFSDKTDVVKVANLVFFFLSISLLFFITHLCSGNYYVPFLVCLYTLLNYHLLSFSVIMMSEVPFMFFTLLCIFIYLKIDFNQPIQRNWLFFVLVVLVSICYHVRSTGLALFVAMAVGIALNKHKNYLIVHIVGFVALGTPWFLRTQSLGGNSYMRQLVLRNNYRPEQGKMEFLDWFSRVWDNFSRYITREIPSGNFNFISVASPEDPYRIKEWIIGIAIASLMVIGLIKLKRHQSIIVLYLLATFGILMLWPTQWYGVRFMLPLVPLLLFLFIQGLTEGLIDIGKRLSIIHTPMKVYTFMIVIGLLGSFRYGSHALTRLEAKAKQPYAPSFDNYFKLAKWVKKYASDSSITVCRKGQLFHMFSDKFVAGYKNTLNTAEQIEYFKKINVDYVVLDQLGYSSTVRYLYPAIKQYPAKFKVIQHLKNPDTYLLKFNPDLGYWGEFKEKKKHGFGTYNWENGWKYEGFWKENLKHGKGKLFLAKGDFLEGVWTNDQLNGLVEHKSSTGELIEKMIYQDNTKIAVVK